MSMSMPMSMMMPAAAHARTVAVAVAVARPLSVLTLPLPLIRPHPLYHAHVTFSSRHASSSSSSSSSSYPSSTRKARTSPGLRAKPIPKPSSAPPTTTAAAPVAPTTTSPTPQPELEPTVPPSSPIHAATPTPGPQQPPAPLAASAPLAPAANTSKPVDPTPASQLPTEALATAATPAATSGWSVAAIAQFAKDALSQTRYGFVKLYTDTRQLAHYKMDDWQKNGTSFNRAAGATLVTPSRRHVRFVAQVKQDWMRFVPFMVYLAVPFSAFTLPIIIRFAPGMLPTGFRGQRIQEMMDHSTLSMQATLAPDLAKVMVDKLDKCAEDIAKDQAMQFQHTIVRRMVNDRETQAQYSEILATLPLLRIHLNFGKFDYIDAIKMASFCRITLPFLFPKARLVRRLSIIRQDDALLVRERFVGLSHDELVEACRMRQLPIPSKEEGPVSDDEMLDLLKEHARFTERLGVSDVPAFVLARVLKAYYVYE